MAKYVQLNPFEDIVNGLNTFMQSQLTNISNLMKREYEASPDQRIRSMDLSYPLKINGMLIGMINISILNRKYEVSNFITTKDRRYNTVNANGQEVNGEWFTTKFHDNKERFFIQLSFRQFRSHAIGLADVVYSSRFEHIDGEPWTTTVKTKEDTAHMWNDPAQVLSIKDFYDSVVSPELTGWTPTVDDITQQTICFM